jgi:hypothetical protein
MTALNCPFSKRVLNLEGYPCGFRIAEIQILVSMTALIAIFLFSDFFYSRQDIGIYLFGAVPCGIFVFSSNYIGKLGLPEAICIFARILSRSDGSSPLRSGDPYGGVEVDLPQGGEGKGVWFHPADDKKIIDMTSTMVINRDKQPSGWSHESRRQQTV